MQNNIPKGKKRNANDIFFSYKELIYKSIFPSYPHEKESHSWRAVTGVDSQLWMMVRTMSLYPQGQLLGSSG